ncbi:MAG: hypothetical protein ABSC08_02250 [Bryobacteraceae bacterium]
MTRPHTATALALGAFTLLTYLHFPGHTWLQQDSQTYVAILQHLDDPSALARDLVATYPHVKWTVYDEIARALHASTGLGYHAILDAQLLLFRFLGLAGVFLLAAAAGLNRLGAIFVSFLFGLGATIGGPEILSLEYEPVPRAFAFLLILAALGYGAFGRWTVSAVLAGLALLYHAPTSAPYWLAVLVYALLFQRLKAVRAVPIAFFGASFLLLLFAALQAGEHEAQPLFTRIPAELISLLRHRGAYNWVDLWPREWLRQYVLLGLFAAGAWFRLRKQLTRELAVLSASLTLYGLLSIVLSWLTLNVLDWSMMSQFQPARGVILVTLFAVVLGAGAAWSAARRGSRLESFAWLLPVIAIPANRLVLELFTNAAQDPVVMKRLVIVVCLSLAAALAAALPHEGTARWQKCALALLVPVAAAFLIPGLGQLANYPQLHTPQLASLSAWARTGTQPDALFFFAGAGHQVTPGIFRVEAQRALFVDWKGGGQVNQNWAFAREWLRRWSWANQAQPPFRTAEEYASAGIDFIVLASGGTLPGLRPVYENADWRVFEVSRSPAR